MGFFSKLFGAANEQIARNIANEVVKSAQQSPQSQNHPQQNPAPVAQQTNSSNNNMAPTGPSGFSWGPVMPAEENQYNFNGTYQQYFDSIFLREFSDYMVTMDLGKYTHLPYYSFIKNGKCALVVELFSGKSAAKKLREDCRRAGIPYLRYYIDVEGWWNTKKYVIERTRNALS